MAVADHELKTPRARTGSRLPGAAIAAVAGKAIAAGFTAVQRVLAFSIFANLTRRIIVLNLAALAVMVIGILYLNQWRDGLIDARVQSLRVQGEIISAAIAASATVDSDVITVNPDRLLEMQTGDAISPLSFFDPSLEFPISPERVAPLLRNLVTPTRTRARIYDQGGLMILDSANIYLITHPSKSDIFFVFTTQPKPTT